MPTPVPNPLTMSQSLATPRSQTPVQGLMEASAVSSASQPPVEGATGGVLDHTEINLSLIESTQEVKRRKADMKCSRLQTLIKMYYVL